MIPSSTVTPGRLVRGRCALCRCRARHTLYGFKVCDYHLNHGEADRPCPYCLQSQLFDPRWTYTVNGESLPRKVEVRQITLPNTIFLDGNGECVMDVEHVMEPSPKGWPMKCRPSVVMIGIGLQMGTNFSITQWASDWEHALLDAARPTLALSSCIYTLGMTGLSQLAGMPLKGRASWPTIDVFDKAMNVAHLLHEQKIPPHVRPAEDIPDDLTARYWSGRMYQAERREHVWRHNHLDVLDLSMRIFQIEWPHDAAETD